MCVADEDCSPDVEFCGYSIPHPSEAKMNIRIQSYGTWLLLFLCLDVYVH